MERKLLVYFEDFDGYKGVTLINEYELIKMQDESDFTDRCITKVCEVTEPDKHPELHYTGWQPNYLIEFADRLGNVVVSGYGTDH